MDWLGFALNAHTLPAFQRVCLPVPLAGEFDAHTASLPEDRDIVRLRIAKDEIAARLGRAVDKRMAHCLAGGKADIATCGKLELLGAEVESETSFEDEHMFFL